MASKNQEIKDRITSRLKGFDMRGNPQLYEKYPPHFKIASVLMALKIVEGDIYVLLTKRSRSLRSHASQVAFPGGMYEEDDETVIQTALREAYEEIGLPINSVEVLAVLNRSMMGNGVVVYPVVGLIPNNFVAEINPSEVELTFSVPLKSFLDKDKIGINHFPFFSITYVNRYLMHHNEDKEFMVWGATCALCVILAKIILQEPDYLELFVGSTNTGNINDCLEEYFNVLYTFLNKQNASSKL